MRSSTLERQILATEMKAEKWDLCKECREDRTLVVGHNISSAPPNKRPTELNTGSKALITGSEVPETRDKPVVLMSIKLLLIYPNRINWRTTNVLQRL